MERLPDDTESSADIGRRELLHKGALAAAAWGVGSLGAYVDRSLAASGNDDVRLLNVALELEYMQERLFTETSPLWSATGDLKQLLEALAGEERQHQRALRGLVRKLGGKPASRTAFGFDYWDKESFLRIATEVETTAAGAYTGLIPRLDSREAVDLAISIAQVEGRHSAALNMRNGEPPAPEALEAPKNEYQAQFLVLTWTRSQYE